MRDIYHFRLLYLTTDEIQKTDFWSFWKWHLDPYKVTEDISIQDLVSISTSFDYKPEGKWEIVSIRQAGLFTIEICLNPIGEIKWTYYCSKNREVYVCYWMSSTFDTIKLLCDNSNTAGMLSFQLLGNLIPTVLLKYDALTFHGVLLEYNKCGIIISASSGIGKTTHARLWRNNKRAIILNGDRAMCCIENNQWIGFSLPWSGTSGECINRDVPIIAFVSLEQARTNHLQRLTGIEAFEVLIKNLLYPAWNRELTEKALDYVESFLENIPVFRLRCRPDIEAVELLDKALSDYYES